ncbi:hypothetical protein Cni_G04945 [Canna indica]|uniref:RING-type E3 ubiquitin transferase n=1 Tax=Canna indica TaxID=4628 RepID=A0AAQ3JVP3_9LILI|nr:hypothetical protein Cni_G04945 [Canna indica]
MISPTMDLYRRVLDADEDVYKGTDPPVSAISPPPPPLCPPPSFSFNSGDQSRRNLTNLLLITAACIAAALLLIFTYYAALRRRRRRPLGAVVTGQENDENEEDGASSGDGELLHHVWYIRTVGLDESTIGSIAVMEYRSSDGLLTGTSSCSVCLGEFSDGQRVRLLPKCAHAFHVDCIDTWLRAHVNCPLCRAHIVEPDSAPAASSAATTASGEPVDSDSVSTASPEVPQMGIQPMEEQENARVCTIDIEIRVKEELSSLPESSSSQRQSDLGFRLQPVRRSVSMDTPWMNSYIVTVDPEQRIIDKEGKDANSEEESVPKENYSKEVVDQKDHFSMERSLSSNGRGFFLSRHGRVARIHSLPM